MNEHKFKIGCVCIDVFSTYAAVVPLQHNNGDSIASGILECFKIMGNKPEILYTDDEAAISSYAMIDYYKQNTSKHYVTRNHADSPNDPFEHSTICYINVSMVEVKKKTHNGMITYMKYC